MDGDKSTIAKGLLLMFVKVIEPIQNIYYLFTQHIGNASAVHNCSRTQFNSC